MPGAARPAHDGQRAGDGGKMAGIGDGCAMKAM